MKRPTKLAAWLVAIFIGLVLAAIIVIKVVFTKDRILSLLTPRIEETINRPVGIGDAGISFSGGIGIWLGDVTVDNKPGFSREPLLALHRLEFKARFWPLLAGRVEIDRLILDHPSLLLEYDDDGNSNLADLQKQSAVADSGETLPDEAVLGAPVMIDHFVLIGGELVLVHSMPPRRMQIGGVNLDLYTQADTGRAATEFSADLIIDSLSFESETRQMAFSEGRPRAHLTGLFDPAQATVRLDTARVEWFGAVLVAEGGIRFHDALSEVQLSAQFLPTPLTEMTAQLLQAGVLTEELNADGSLEGEFEINTIWPIPTGTIPDWSAHVDITDLTYVPPTLSESIGIHRVELQGQSRALSWTLSGGTLPRGTFSGSGALDRVFSDDPDFTSRLVIDAELSALTKAVTATQDLNMRGDVHADINAFGTIKQWKKMRLNGRVDSRNFSVLDPAWCPDTINAAFEWELTGYDVTLRRTAWRAGDSRGTITGRVADLIPAVLASFDTPDVPRANLEVICGYLNLDRLLEEPAPGNAGGSGSGGNVSEDPVGFPAIAADGTIACDTVIYSGMKLTALRGPFVFRDNVLTVDPIRARVYGGRAEGACRWDISDWENPAFGASVTADSLESDGLLSRFLNWSGGLTGRATFTGEFAGRGRDRNSILPTLVGSGNARMATGTLKAAPLLEAAGSRLGVRGLDQPRAIRDLLLLFRVDAGRVLTDSLRFHTNDMNWSAVGSFGFDQTLDYLVTTKLPAGVSGDLPGLVQGSTVRMGIKGTIRNPKIELDLSDAGRDLLENLLTPKTVDSTGAMKNATDLLKGLFKKKKP